MSSDESQPEQKVHTDYNAPFRCRASQLKSGEWLSGTIYYRVETKINNSHKVTDSLGHTLTVEDTVLENEMISAEQFDNEVKVTRSEMVERLIHAGDCVFTIKFRKQLTGKEMCDKLTEEKYDTQPAAKKSRICQHALKLGEVRVLTGYLRNVEHVMGRSNVIDLNVQGSHRERQVDHRTLEELILKRVKYTLKK
jgi:hypothetical protein